MIDHSKGFRCGTLQSVKRGELECKKDENIPFIILVLECNIPIGLGEVSKESTQVVLLGEDVVRWWAGMQPAPKIGDAVRISYATMYVRNGILTFRVQDPSLVEVIPAHDAKLSANLDNYETINARDYFTAIIAERQKQKERE